MTSTRLCGLCIILMAVGLILPGCKKKGAASGSGAAATVGQDRIDAARDAMTRDMQEVSFASLTKTDIGRTCVVTAATMADTTKLGPPPPPPGMVHLMGQTTIYRGELDDVSSDGLTIRAAYPTPGNFKKLQIAKEDIESIHLAK